MGLSDFTKNNNNNNTPPSGPTGPGAPNFPGAYFGWFGGNPNGGLPTNPKQNNDDEILKLFINYNEKFKVNDNVMFRDSIIEQLLSVLIGKDKPNALLIGTAGVGKTAIVETLANMLANDDPLIPDQLKGYTIWELPLANVVAGAMYMGQLEDNVKQVIEKMEDTNFKGILFIDEIHQLINGSQSSEKISQILKPALARGTIHVIGATTLQEANSLMDNPALNRRFSRILVDELTHKQTIEILKKAKPAFINHYTNIDINDNLLEMVATLADQYRPAGSHRPDNALTLLDRTLGEAVVYRKAQIQKLNDKIKEDPNDVQSTTLLQAIQQAPTIPITDNQIKKTAISLATGNSKSDTIDLQSTKLSLSKIKGQNDVCDKVTDIMIRTESNLFPKQQPTTLLFIGPSGVGKTEIAKIMAKEFTGQKPIILNMTQFSDAATINRIIGSPAGYIGSDSHAELPFDELETNPYAVILLDEFEKAHSAVKRLFYSVFDEGNLTDNHGKTIDFSKSIIIATTNAAHQDHKHKMGFGEETNQTASIKDLSKFFDPALLNRFNYIIHFNKIDKETYRSILIDKYHREIERIRTERPNIKLLDDIPDDVLKKMVDETYHEEFGARPAFKTIKTYIEDQAMSTP